MDCCSLHHAEFYVKDGEKLTRELTIKYRFAVIAKRATKFHNQWVLSSGNVKFLVTQPIFKISDASIEGHCEDPYITDFYPPLGIDSTSISVPLVNTVCNVALRVKDVKACVQRVCKAGGIILKPLHTLSDCNGMVDIAVIKSCVGNVIHTIIDDRNYTGLFLPGFECVDSPQCYNGKPLVTHIDHVTFACSTGSSEYVLHWYENNFGMNRFFINSNEDKDEGFVINNADVGVRLKAFEYWKCAETGLYSEGSENSIKFVIAEALADQGPNQLSTFLEEHKGDGIQHIGLHTEDMVDTVSTLKQQGVNFVEPPYTYYTQVGKLKEIEEINEDVEILKLCGILVDNEENTDDSSSEKRAGGKNESTGEQRYLMQKFTQPIFGEKTFFLEIIQRFGARGFGAGNITALWRSLQAYLSDVKS